MEEKLTLFSGHSPWCKVPAPPNGFFDKKKPVVDIFNYRLPWSLIDYDEIYKSSWHVTVNADYQCDWVTNENKNDKTYMNNRLKNLLTKLKLEGLFKNITVVYEYGELGKEYGKLHWHMLVDTCKIRLFEQEFNREFGTTKQRCKATTVCKKITIDKGTPNVPELMVANYKENVDYVLKHYMRKESQNRIKCLYTTIKKK